VKREFLGKISSSRPKLIANMFVASPDLAAVGIISALLLFFAAIVAFFIDITSSEASDLQYEKV
jgi:hypothetical protein